MTPEEIARELGGARRCGAEWASYCPVHEADGAAHEPTLNTREKDGKIVFNCRAGCSQDSIITAIKARGLWSNGNGANRPQRRREKHRLEKLGREVARYLVRDVTGTISVAHVRFEDDQSRKTFKWFRDGKWSLGGLKSTDLMPYGSEDLTDKPDDTIAAWFEGEKARDAAARCEAVRQAGIVPIATVTGAKLNGGDLASDAVLSRLIRFRRHIFWPDADAVGKAHAARYLSRLMQLGVTDVRMVDWPEAPPSGDAANFEGSDIAMLALIESAQPFAPTALPPFGQLASDIPEEPIRWVVRDYFARKKLTEIIGEGGVGKTATLIDLIARVTRGQKVFGQISCDAANVSILSAEDDAADTLVPRLRAAGADPGRVRIFPKYFETDGDVHPITFPEHLPLIENDLRRDKTALFIIDPIAAFIGGKTETHNDSSTRKFLMHIDILAVRSDCSIVYVRHTNKNSSETNAKNRGSGSVAFTNAPRLSYAIGFDPNDTEPEAVRKRILAWSKGNISAPQPARAFRLCADENEAIHVEWLTETFALTANDLFREPRQPRRKEALEEAIQFLHDELADGSRDAAEIAKQAEVRGISRATLARACLKISVHKMKKGFAGGWVWSLSNNEM